MRIKRLIKASCVAVTFLLGSCTYGHEIDISLRNGKLIFTFDEGKRVALQQLSVVELSSEPNVVWRLDSVDYNGQDVAELGYGAVPSGTKHAAAAKPLRVGQLYRVELNTVDGGGSQEFVISPDPANGQSNQATVVRE
jgi:hypothetical protein